MASHAYFAPSVPDGSRKRTQRDEEMTMSPGGILPDSMQKGCCKEAKTSSYTRFGNFFLDSSFHIDDPSESQDLTAGAELMGSFSALNDEIRSSIIHTASSSSIDETCSDEPSGTYPSGSDVGGHAEADSADPAMRPDSPPVGPHGAATALLLSGKLPAFMPVRTFVSAFSELPQGARSTLSTVITAWRAGKIESEAIESFCASVAWQSPSLRVAFSSTSSSASTMPAGEHELLSAADFEELMSGAPSVRSSCAPSPTMGPRVPLSSPAPCWQKTRSKSSDDVRLALEVAINGSMLDSTRTQRLTEVLRRCPTLESVFVGNGWDPVREAFVESPNWDLAKKDISCLAFSLEN